MVKRVQTTPEEKTSTAAGYDLRVHFKNTYETAKAIKGMSLADAEAYLEAVLEHKRCVPFTKYEGSTGRTGQAKEFGMTKGRWPEKSVRIVLALLKNAKSNAEAKRLNVDNVYVKKAEVNQAQKGRRRTYRAHGRINAYLSSNCHVKLTCVERPATIKKEANTNAPAKVLRSVNVRTQVRKATAAVMKAKKWVQVGATKKQ